ncbi:hypothetical protein [Myxococcus sp. RHSTA-1-4]|uniref:hypothetical protein n=1 Tax=Myxococcus sp. RHSTA-1-4 TaxID=2874601 RepID=UPI001CC0662B|nr:hypothetical protein [Myxococcus sp. RHSTA-1-4]MBZ4422451.1 hypothetical protein [Myxococcus sp. RHSTA-1-4]
MHMEGPAAGDSAWAEAPLCSECAPDDGGVPADDTVLVTNHESYHTLAGVAQRPYDMSANPPHLLVPDAGTFTRIDGTATDGGYLFTGVPQGTTYYLRRNRTVVVTDARHVEIGTDLLGRPDAILTDIGVTPLELDLSNLAPWAPYGSAAGPSSLELVSGQLDVAGDVYFYDEPLAGQTHVTTTQAESWNMGLPFSVFEAARGDALYVNQLGAVDAGALPNGNALTSLTVVRSVELAPFDFTPDGVTPLPLSGVMQSVPTQALSVDWRLPEYTARAAQIHPSATPQKPLLVVEAGAHRPESGWVSYSGTLLRLELPTGASFNFTRLLSYGTPFPSTWARVGSAVYPFRYRDVLPDGSGRTFSMSFHNMIVRDRVEGLAAAPLRPRVTPPRGLTIDGLDANVQRQVSSPSPVVAWLPPDVGNPTGYRVALHRYDESLGYGRASLQLYIHVPGSTTQVRLPPGVLLPGSIYFLLVTAMDVTGHDVKSRPFNTLGGLPQGTADVISSFFTTP